MQKRKFGILCMILGIVLVLGAVYLSLNNRQEDLLAQESSAEVMPALIEQVQENIQSTQSGLDLQKPVNMLTEEEKKMTEMVIDGIPYIGYLSIQKLDLQLPVISTWDLNLLNVAPCRYTGTVRGEDLVLMAHNYSSHFGRIYLLELGDRIMFTDMDGDRIVYEVVGKDVLASTAVEEMTSGAFDMTLFTCNYSGEARITIYCNKIKV